MGQQQISAKFKVSRVTEQSPITGKDGALRESAEIEMTPDYAAGANAQWAEYTPSGVFRFNVNNPEVIKALTQGTSVTILIQPEFDRSVGKAERVDVTQ